MKTDQEIKVYGTLVNHTVDSELSDSIHNDVLSYAKQSYDDLFGESEKINNFQDVINRRIKGITRETVGNTPGTHINENLYIGGPIYVKDGNNNWVPLDLAGILNRLSILESYWRLDGNNLIAKNGCSATASGFYDRTVN